MVKLTPKPLLTALVEQFHLVLPVIYNTPELDSGLMCLLTSQSGLQSEAA